jgi:lactate dehydrogenase-like 2-hydroxyacid dehydrogenase
LIKDITETSSMAIELLQLCHLTPGFEAALAQRFNVFRWYEIADKSAFLGEHGSTIKAIVTNGPTGAAAELVAALPALEIIAIGGVGFDKVDLAEARRRNYRVTNTPDVLTAAVADLAIGLLIASLRRIVSADHFARSGDWPKGPFALGSQVSGRRIGIYGLGRIGRAIARRLSGFDTEIFYTSRSQQHVPYAFCSTLLELAEKCDVLIIAASASPENAGAVDPLILEALGRDGHVINVARGSIIDEPALIDALEQGRLAGAALDVFVGEPRIPARLVASDKVVLTPHIGVATHETRQAIADLVLANLDAHFSGRPLLTPVV